MGQRLRLEPGGWIGQYRIVRLLGRGGMGEVYEAEHRVLERKYALKLLPEDFASLPEAVRRFEREAKVMANLNHPHIVRVDDYGQTQGQYWLRMELVRGLEPEVITLGDWAAKHGPRLDQAEFAALLRQILEAVAHAHQQGIVHRDLKPGNVLLERDANGQIHVKVSDFGLARIIGQEKIHSQARMSIGGLNTVAGAQSIGDSKTIADEGTSTRALLGTWEYMSPEQRRCEEPGAPSDVYSLGLIGFRLLTGQDLGLKMPSRLIAELCPEWDLFLERALEQKAEARYANAQEMLAAFAHVERAVGLGSNAQSPTSAVQAPLSTVRSPQPTAPASTVNRGLQLPWAVASLIVLLLLVYGGWQFGIKPWQQNRTTQAELARIEAGKRAQAEGLRGVIEAALAKDDLKAAGAGLAELEALVGVSGAKELRGQYEAKAGEQEVMQRFGEASAARANLTKRGLDRGQGMGVKLDELEAAWLTAQGSKEGRSWGAALSGFEEVLRRVRELETLEGQRKAALGAQAQALLSRSSASQARAAEDGGADWAQAEEKLKAAEGLLSVGKFVEAKAGFGEAEPLYVRAKEQAVAVQGYRRAKAEYEKLLAESAMVELLRAHGGEEWGQVQERVKQAVSLGEARAGEGAAQYTAAAKAWPVALKAAQAREKAAKVAAGLAAAQKAEAAQDWDEAAKQADAVLRLESTSSQAQQLKSRAAAGKRKAQAEGLRGVIERALARADLKAAGAGLTELEALVGVSGAKELRGQFEAKVAEQEVMQRFGEASVARENLIRNGLDRGQGMGVKLDELEAAWLTAQGSKEGRSWGAALSGFEEVLRRVAELETLEGQRKAALGAQAQAVLARSSASQARAAEDGGADWAQAEEKLKAAEGLLSEGKFVEAKAGFVQAELLYVGAKDWAVALKAAQAREKAAKVAAGLAAAQKAEAAQDWEEAAKQADAVLKLESTSSEAQQLKSRAAAGKRKAQAVRLRGVIEAALARDDLKAAGAGLTELEALVGVSGAKELRTQYEAKAGEQEVMQRFGEASAARENLTRNGLDRGQGMGVKLDELEAAWRTAQGSKEGRSWGAALSGFEEVLRRVAELETLEGQRKAALGAQAQAVLARSSASQARAAEDGSADWAQAEDKLKAAEGLLSEGKFVEAKAGFVEAERLYVQAKDWAVALNAAQAREKAAKVAEQEAMRRFGEASVARENLTRNGLDRGQGIGVKLDELEAAWRAAQGSKEGRSWRAALSGFEEVLRRVAELETLEGQRKAALGAQAQAVLARSSASQARAAEDGGSDWAQAEEKLKAAEGLLSEGKFVEAKAGFAEAEPLYVRAKDWAVAFEAAQAREKAAKAAAEESPWTNSLGMVFLPVPGTKVRFGVWDVRVQDFEAFVSVTRYDATAGLFSVGSGGLQQRGDTWKNPGFRQESTHPVCGVSWQDAESFCQWLTQKERNQGLLSPGQSYRLPKDAEWSVAVGLQEPSEGTPKDKNGKVMGVYPWGTQWPPPIGAGNYAGEEAKDGNWPSDWAVIPSYRDGYARTSPVGSFNPGKLGLYDMGGNVWQWCEDYYDGQGGSRVLRGGSWNDDELGKLLSSCRRMNPPDYRSVSFGFRCVLAADGSVR